MGGGVGLRNRVRVVVKWGVGLVYGIGSGRVVVKWGVGLVYGIGSG